MSFPFLLREARNGMTDYPLELRTERLLLRRWVPADRAPFFRINSDPLVCSYLPKQLTREESDELADRIEQHFAQHGSGLWAVEIPQTAPFIGFVGLATPRFEAAFKPCIEIGWRLSAEHWGHGYATEAARAALEFGFRTLELDEIVSFTVPDNLRSRRVMEKIGLQHDPANDFEHPSLPAGHRLRPHVFYRLTRSQFLQSYTAE